MKTLQIAIPVLKGKANFTVDKGKPWSVIEHIIMEALHKKEWSAVALAQHANIPRRVVIESIIRLMRAGWVELKDSVSEVVFKASVLGEIALMKPELPNVLERKRRPTNFIYELFDGNIFRNRDWNVVSNEVIKERSSNEAFVVLQSTDTQAAVDVSAMLDILLDKDEIFVNAEPSNVTQRYVVVSVRDGVVHGLPSSRDLTGLRKKLLDVASAHPHPENGVIEHPVPGARFDQNMHHEKLHSVNFNLSDIILGGEAHKKVLLETINAARSKLVIHSTFISEQHFLCLLPALSAAVQRGVQIHIFWGQNESLDEIVSTQSALGSLRSNIDVISLGSGLMLHPHSTGSHSKFIISDSEPNGDFVAILGSCNWFTSSFYSYEASVVLRDPAIVKDVLGFASRLCCVHDGIWTPFATELVGISKKVASKIRNNPSSSNAQASLVIGGNHNGYVFQARDEAEKRIFVISHRLGGTLYSSILPAFTEAVKSRGVASDIYYGRNTAPVTKANAKEAIANSLDAGVSIKIVENPRLHAKILGWDDDNILIGSLNWLSADPTEPDSLKEIGIFIKAKGAASLVVDDLVRNMES
ncbi:UNVERIFIED_ORG: phosphatidylserine/phosphatidylglycerophosphate/cardiolipin synthase-like enzyme [Pseudomonas fluorescens]|nr:phosphatidylserine/phosphatidylglycerophosphate/cardiolipin synthase-like enzyme [Pseudomonas fluorescens]